jgi:hypothetical protein
MKAALLAAGMSQEEIDRCIRCIRLHVLHMHTNWVHGTHVMRTTLQGTHDFIEYHGRRLWRQLHHELHVDPATAPPKFAALVQKDPAAVGVVGANADVYNPRGACDRHPLVPARPPPDDSCVGPDMCDACTARDAWGDAIGRHHKSPSGANSGFHCQAARPKTRVVSRVAGVAMFVYTTSCCSNIQR